MRTDMNDGFSGAAGIAIAKYGLPAVLGMVGTTLIYMALPPTDANGHLNKREFFFRLFSAGVFSSLFGDAAVQYLVENFERFHADQHAAAVYLLVGAPAWLITRAGAIWLQKRKGKDLGEIVKDVKNVDGGN